MKPLEIVLEKHYRKLKPFHKGGELIESSATPKTITLPREKERNPLEGSFGTIKKCLSNIDATQNVQVKYYSTAEETIKTTTIQISKLISICKTENAAAAAAANHSIACKEFKTKKYFDDEFKAVTEFLKDVNQSYIHGSTTWDSLKSTSILYIFNDTTNIFETASSKQQSAPEIYPIVLLSLTLTENSKSISYMLYELMDKSLYQLMKEIKDTVAAATADKKEHTQFNLVTNTLQLACVNIHAFLTICHSTRRTHCDIKPHNILLKKRTLFNDKGDPRGIIYDVKVGDFGLMRQDHVHMRIYDNGLIEPTRGTPAYMLFKARHMSDAHEYIFDNALQSEWASGDTVYDWQGTVGNLTNGTNSRSYDDRDSSSSYETYDGKSGGRNSKSGGGNYRSFHDAKGYVAGARMIDYAYTVNDWYAFAKSMYEFTKVLVNCDIIVTNDDQTKTKDTMRDETMEIISGTFIQLFGFNTSRLSSSNVNMKTSQIHHIIKNYAPPTNVRLILELFGEPTPLEMNRGSDWSVHHFLAQRLIYHIEKYDDFTGNQGVPENKDMNMTQLFDSIKSAAGKARVLNTVKDVQSQDSPTTALIAIKTNAFRDVYFKNLVHVFKDTSCNDILIYKKFVGTTATNKDLIYTRDENSNNHILATESKVGGGKNKSGKGKKPTRLQIRTTKSGGNTRF